MALLSCLLACACADEGTTATAPTTGSTGSTGSTGTGDVPTGTSATTGGTATTGDEAVPDGAVTALDDPDLWLIRDCLFDENGAEDRAEGALEVQLVGELDLADAGDIERDQGHRDDHDRHFGGASEDRHPSPPRPCAAGILARDRLELQPRDEAVNRGIGNPAEQRRPDIPRRDAPSWT